MRWLWVVNVAALAVLASTAGGQEREQSSPYFECPYVNYFDHDCPQLEKEQARVRPQADDEREPGAGKDEPEAAGDWLQEVPEHLLPLFPKESLAPDAPALYRLLLVRPTLDNARRYVRWYSRRMRRIQAAQDLIAAAGAEFLAERGAGEQGP